MGVVSHRVSELCTSVERLAWAKASGCPWIAWKCAYAARAGRLEALRFQREHELTCAYAAMGGHLAVLKWAREQGCPWDGGAARGGHLAVLRRVREHDCPWNAWNVCTRQ